MAVSGLRISWAAPAASSPIVARRSARDIRRKRSRCSLKRRAFSRAIPAWGRSEEMKEIVQSW